MFETPAETPAATSAKAAATLLDRLDRHVRDRPGKAALLLRRGDRFEVWSYADVAARTSRWAGRLAAATGEAEPDRRIVLIVADHGIDTYAAFLGAMAAGLAPGMLPPPTVRQPLDAYVDTHRQVIARTRPMALVASEAFVDAIAAAAEGRAPVLSGLAGPSGPHPAPPWRRRAPEEMGYAALRLRDLDLARYALERATQVSPHRPGGWLWLGEALAARGDGLAALGAVARGLDACPDDPALAAAHDRLAA